MMKIWMEAFWKSHPDATWSPPAVTRLGPAYAATLALAALTLAISLWPQALIGFSLDAAAALAQER
jgi:multicomponent Na+:H+ antiporter subunit D